MSRKVSSILAAAAISALAATQAKAAFVYDLRFSDGSHSVTAVAGQSYTLQLWGRITGDTTLTNDGWVNGFTSIVSSQASGGAILTGGITNNGTSLGTHAQSSAAGATIGAGGTDLNSDSVTDWGSASTLATTSWLKWAGGANPGYQDGTTDSQSQQVGSNGWEILLASFTVNANTVGSGTTTFTPTFVNAIKSGLGTVPGITYTQDGATVNNISSTTALAVSFTGTTGDVPEPASLGVLALGALGLLARRRK